MKACEKATYLKEKSNHTQLSFWEKLTMRFHFFMCPPCKKYGHDSSSMNKAIRNCRQDKVYAEEHKIEIKEKVRNS